MSGIWRDELPSREDNDDEAKAAERSRLRLRRERRLAGCEPCPCDDGAVRFAGSVMNCEACEGTGYVP